MARETKEQKSVRLLMQQRVRFEVLTRGFVAGTVRGDGEDYEFRRDPRGRWDCTCPHGRGTCSHLLQVKDIYRAVLPALPEE